MPRLSVIPLSLSLAACLLAASCDGGGGAGGDVPVPPGAPEAPEGGSTSAPFPKSVAVSGVSVRFETLVERAPGSDNWALTWAEDGAQYVTWGDGGGFGGDDQEGRVSMGVARIEGEPEDFTAVNVWGGKDALAEAAYPGKSYGLLAVGPDLWLWRTGEASDESAFELQDLFVSRDGGLTFEPAGVSFTADEFAAGGFFAPTFLQFGPGYAGARDEYVYVYAPERKNDEWEVQKPGEIALLRVPVRSIGNRASYEFFAGLDAAGTPAWTSALDDRKPVLSDAENGVMRTSVTFNAGLGRYFLVTQQGTRQKGGYIGIYEATEPWGPWRSVLVEDAWDLGLQEGEKSVYWNFSNKWTSADGRQAALVYTGPGDDNLGVVMVELAPPGG